MKNRFFLIAPITVSLLNSLLYWPLVLRVIPTDVLGYQLFLMQISILVTPLLVVGLNVTLIRQNTSVIYLPSDTINRLVTSYAAIAIQFSIIALIVQNSLLEIAAFTSAQSTAILLFSLCRREELNSVFASSTFIIQFFAPFLALGLIVFTDFEYFVQLTSLCTSLASIIILRLYFSIGRVKLKEFKSLFRQSYRLTPFLFGSLIMLYGHKLLLGMFFSPQYVTFFQMPAVVAGGLLTAYTMLSPIIFERVLRADEVHWYKELELIQDRISKYIPSVFLLAFPAALVTYILTPTQFPRSEIVFATIIFAFALPVAIATDILIQAAIRLGKNEYLAVSVYGAITAILLMVFFLRATPVIGVSIATTCGYLVRLILLQTMMRVSNPIKFFLSDEIRRVFYLTVILMSVTLIYFYRIL